MWTLDYINIKFEARICEHFDSLNLGPDSQVKGQICAILKYEGTIVTVNKVPVQQQHGSVDCGLFAIANIIALCLGYEPNKIQNEKSPDFMLRSRAVFYVDVNTRPKRNKPLNNQGVLHM